MRVLETDICSARTTEIVRPNVFLRNIVIAPRATCIRLEFVPFSHSLRALPLYVGGQALLPVSLVAVAHLSHRADVLADAAERVP